jgi:hypothetical protein
METGEFMRERDRASPQISLCVSVLDGLRQIMTAQHYFEINKEEKEHIDVQEMFKVWGEKL